VTIGGVTHTSAAPNYAWINSKLNDAFPSLASEEIFVLWKQYGTKRAKVKINEDPSLAPVLQMLIPLGVDNIVQPLVYFMAAKEGTKIWAWSDDGLDNPPFLISWTFGKGETWSNTLGMGYAWWRLDQPAQGGNPFALDVFMNMVLYSAGRELPSDILKVHTVRRGLMNYEEAKAWVLSVVDFADRFGANTGKVYNEIAGADAARVEARAVYVQQEFIVGPNFRASTANSVDKRYHSNWRIDAAAATPQFASLTPGFRADLVPLICGSLPFANVHEELVRALLDLDAALQQAE
jgi:hypothetical protein